MKAINNMRAKFLFGKFPMTSFDMDICQMIQKLFDIEPSLTETLDCKRCGHSDINTFPIVDLSDRKFSNNFSNLEEAIISNFCENIKCKECQNDVECTREFGPHIFIRVCINHIPSEPSTRSNSCLHDFGTIQKS